jgi:autophagy-related protein 16-1
LYRTNANNAQRVLTLLDSTQAQSARISVLEQSLAETKKLSETRQIRTNDLQELLKEKDNVIQILKDELSAHQLELVQKEETLRKCQTTLATVQEENKTLLDRWIKQKSAEANKMNEANEFVETALKSKATLFSPSSLLGMFRKPSNETDVDKQSEEDRSVYKSVVPTRLLKRVTGHSEEITCLTISPNGMYA